MGWWWDDPVDDKKVKQWGKEWDEGTENPNIQQSKRTNVMGEETQYELPSLGNLSDITFGGSLFGNNKSKDDYDNYQWGNLLNFLPAENNSLADNQNEVNLDPFQDFKWGMNMPTFKVAKGAFDMGGTAFDLINKYNTLNLREKMFDEQKRVGDRDYLDAKELRNIKFDQMDHNRLAKNNFIEQYGGPDGNYIKQAPVNRRSLG